MPHPIYPHCNPAIRKVLAFPHLATKERGAERLTKPRNTQQAMPGLLNPGSGAPMALFLLPGSAGAGIWGGSMALRAGPCCSSSFYARPLSTHFRTRNHSSGQKQRPRWTPGPRELAPGLCAPFGEETTSMPS